MPNNQRRSRSKTRQREKDRSKDTKYSADDEKASTEHSDALWLSEEDDDGDGRASPGRPDSLDRFMYSLPLPQGTGMEDSTDANSRTENKTKKKKKRVRFALPPEDDDPPALTSASVGRGDKSSSGSLFHIRASQHTPPPEHASLAIPNIAPSHLSSPRPKPPVMRNLDEIRYLKPYSLKPPLPSTEQPLGPYPTMTSSQYDAGFVINRATLSPNSLEKLKPSTSHFSTTAPEQTEYNPGRDRTDVIKTYATDVSDIPGPDGRYSSKILPWYLLPMNYRTRQPSPVYPMGKWSPVAPPGTPKQSAFSDVLPYSTLGEWALGVPTHQPPSAFPEIRRLQASSYRLLHVKQSAIMGQSMILEEGWRTKVHHWQRPVRGSDGAEDKLKRHRANQTAKLRDKERKAFKHLIDIIIGTASRWPEKQRHTLDYNAILNDPRGPKPMPSDSSMYSVIHDALTTSKEPGPLGEPAIVRRPLPDFDKYMPDVIDRGSLGSLKCHCCEPRNREQRLHWRGELPTKAQVLPPITSSSPDQDSQDIDDIMYYRTESSPLPPVITQLDSVTSELSSIRPPDQTNMLEQVQGLAMAEHMGLFGDGISKAVFSGGPGKPLQTGQSAAEKWLTDGILAAWTNSRNETTK